MKTVTSKDGTSIAYDVYGSGPVVIIVGGAMVVRSYSGHIKLAEMLAPHFTVVNYDRRGRGDSSDKTNVDTFKIEREIEDIQALMDATGGSASLIGFSSGGALALKAAESGLNIKKIAIYETPFMVGDDNYKVDHVNPLKEFIRNNEPKKAAKYFMTQIFGMPGFAVALMHLTPYWSRAVAGANTLPYDMMLMTKYHDPAMFSGVNIPVLVLAGEKGQPRLIRGAKAAADALPKSQFQLMKGQSHMVSMPLLAPILDKFLGGK